MSFASDVTAALFEGRALAESLMVDTCTVQAITGVTTDPLTGVDVPAYALVYGPTIAPYFGKCKFQSSEIQEATPEAGGATFTVLRSRADFPVGSFLPVKDQIVTCVTSALDPLLPGRQFRILAPQAGKSQATAYRLAVEAVV